MPRHAGQEAASLQLRQRHRGHVKLDTSIRPVGQELMTPAGRTLQALRIPD